MRLIPVGHSKGIIVFSTKALLQVGLKERVCGPSRFLKSPGAFLVLMLFLVGIPFPQCWSQGTILLVNRVGSDSSAPIYGPETCDLAVSKAGNTSTGIPAGNQFYTGSLLAGGGYCAAILAASGSNEPLSALRWSTATTTFRTGTGSGFIAGKTITLEGVPADAPVATVVVFAWENWTGSYSDPIAAYWAWLSGQICGGRSQPVNVYRIGGLTNSPPTPVGLQSFNLYYPAWGSNNLVIDLHPFSQTVPVGKPVTFSAACKYPGTASHQWLFNGDPIPGATNAVFTHPNVQVLNAGVYACIFSNACQGAIFTSNATLTVATLDVNRLGGQPVFQWNAGSLEAAPESNGPWNTVTNATSPLTNSVLAPRAFYRLRF
jgi:hypothetical protein